MSFAALEEANLLVANKYLNAAMNRIYYAGYYIVSALAVIDGKSPKKHKGLIGYFHKEYIHAGIIDGETGKILKKAFENRMAVDYGDFVTITKSQNEEYLKNMRKFVEEVKELIDNKIAVL